MCARSLVVCWLLILGIATPAVVQFGEGIEPGGTSWRKQHLQVALRLRHQGYRGACVGLYGYVPVPFDWPEQQVKVLHEEISPGATINYQTIDGAVRVMTFKIAHLEAGQEAKALVTFEIRRNQLLCRQKTTSSRSPTRNNLRA